MLGVGPEKGEELIEVSPQVFTRAFEELIGENLQAPFTPEQVKEVLAAFNYTRLDIGSNEEFAGLIDILVPLAKRSFRDIANRVNQALAEKGMPKRIEVVPITALELWILVKQVPPPDDTLIPNIKFVYQVGNTVFINVEKFFSRVASEKSNDTVISEVAGQVFEDFLSSINTLIDENINSNVLNAAVQNYILEAFTSLARSYIAIKRGFYDSLISNNATYILSPHQYEHLNQWFQGVVNGLVTKNRSLPEKLARQPSKRELKLLAENLCQDLILTLEESEGTQDKGTVHLNGLPFPSDLISSWLQEKALHAIKEIKDKIDAICKASKSKSLAPKNNSLLFLQLFLAGGFLPQEIFEKHFTSKQIWQGNYDSRIINSAQARSIYHKLVELTVACVLLDQLGKHEKLRLVQGFYLHSLGATKPLIACLSKLGAWCRPDGLHFLNLLFREWLVEYLIKELIPEDTCTLSGTTRFESSKDLIDEISRSYGSIIASNIAEFIKGFFRVNPKGPWSILVKTILGEVFRRARGNGKSDVLDEIDPKMNDLVRVGVKPDGSGNFQSFIKQALSSLPHFKGLDTANPNGQMSIRFLSYSNLTAEVSFLSADENSSNSNFLRHSETKAINGVDTKAALETPKLPHWMYNVYKMLQMLRGVT